MNADIAQFLRIVFLRLHLFLRARDLFIGDCFPANTATFCELYLVSYFKCDWRENSLFGFPIKLGLKNLSGIFVEQIKGKPGVFVWNLWMEQQWTDVDGNLWLIMSLGGFARILWIAAIFGCMKNA